jgi:hypothetical protein
VFTCDEVVSGLFQGDFPDEDVDWTRFDDVVTMTESLPSARLRLGGLWLHVPIWDGEMKDAGSPPPGTADGRSVKGQPDFPVPAVAHSKLDPDRGTDHDLRPSCGREP